MTRGRFITFEGIEGSGKTSHLERLGPYLAERGIHFVVTREPGGTPFGCEIRRILLDRAGAARQPTAELLLYLADRVQDLHEVIRPALDRGIHVLCDRYHDATQAYQGFARGVPQDLIDHLAEALQIVPPDLTLIFEVDVKTGLERARRRNRKQISQAEDRFDQEDAQFHGRVAEGYRVLAAREPHRFRRIETSGPFDQVQDEVRQLVGAFLEK
jgi:dTMP kinase